MKLEEEKIEEYSSTWRGELYNIMSSGIRGQSGFRIESRWQMKSDHLTNVKFFKTIDEHMPGNF
jgi:hypothetical protein